MILETLAGSLLGGAARLIPEVLKHLDKKNERAHELAMCDKQLELERAKSTSQLQQTHAEGDIQIATRDLDALIEGVRAQATLTGIRWVDALNYAVRPVLAVQWLLVLWPAVIVTGIVSALVQGVPAAAAMSAAFGEPEKTLCASIASFWLVDRSLRKLFGR